MSRLILLVEDDPAILAANRRMLELSGYGVMAAQSLREARDRLAFSPPDLLVLDIMLPDGSGLALCEELRRAADIPILFLTALGGKNEIVAGLRAGGDDYLAKPYDFGELLARIEALLRRARRPAERWQDVGPIRLDWARQRAYLHGEDARLKPREFTLLALLVRHMGEYLTPEALYETIWGADVNSDLRTVYVHIAGLRKKLRMDGTQGLRIENEREKGYRLVL